MKTLDKKSVITINNTPIVHCLLEDPQPKLYQALKEHNIELQTRWE